MSVLSFQFGTVLQRGGLMSIFTEIVLDIALVMYIVYMMFFKDWRR